MHKHSILAFGCVVAAACGLSSGANAGVVFSDNFNSYDYQLNWVPPSAIWTVPSGSVDLIGETPSGTGYDFFPGNGGYVDLDGSTNKAGTLTTTDTFGPGAYTLSFDLAGNARGDVNKTTTISLGGWSQSLTLASDAAYQLYTYKFTTSTGGTLSFADSPGGNGNIGNILDNVTLVAVPESGTWAMMALGFAGLGFAGYRRAKGADTALFAA